MGRVEEWDWVRSAPQSGLKKYARSARQIGYASTRSPCGTRRPPAHWRAPGPAPRRNQWSCNGRIAGGDRTGEGTTRCRRYNAGIALASHHPGGVAGRGLQPVLKGRHLSTMRAAVGSETFFGSRGSRAARRFALIESPEAH